MKLGNRCFSKLNGHSSRTVIPVSTRSQLERGAFPKRAGIQRVSCSAGNDQMAVESETGLNNTQRANGSTPLEFSLNPYVASLKPSKTVAITDLAQSLRQQGKDVIGLAAGEPDFCTPQPIVDAGIEAIQKGITKYSPNAGTQQLREAICQKLKEENGLDYSPDCVVVSNGAKQSVWQAVLATCGPGDEVLIPAPFWVSYPEMARLAGASPVILPCPMEDNFLLKAEDLEKNLTENSRLLILCSPSNPTGAVYSKQELLDIAEVVGRHPRLMVLSDEIYEYIIYSPASHHSFASLPHMSDRTLTVNGFSKGFAMTGWRLGYIAAPKPYARAMASIQSQSTSGASSISQHAALAALKMGKSGGPPVQHMVQKFEERRAYVIDRLEAIPGVQVNVPNGAFYVFPEMSAFFGEGVFEEGYGEIPDSDTLCKYLVEKAEVALVPGDAFGMSQCIRISYAASLETLTKGLDRIELALNAIRRR